MTIRVDVSGLSEFTKKMNDLPRLIDATIIETMAEDGKDWEADVRANTPKDTGDLRRSWTLDPPSKAGKAIEMELSNNLEYAEHVEYGHRQEPGRFVPAIGKRLKADYVQGYNMLRDGTARLEESLADDVQRALDSM